MLLQTWKERNKNSRELDYLNQAKQANWKIAKKYRDYKVLAFYFLGLLRQSQWGSGFASTWLWHVLYPIWPQLACLPTLLGKEPGWSLYFCINWLLDCSACRSSSSLMLPSADGSGENTWGQWTANDVPTACRPICEGTIHRSFCGCSVSPPFSKELTLEGS